MFTLITRYSGKDISNLFKKYFFNIIGKVSAIYEQGEAIFDEQISVLREPNFLFASYLVEQVTFN